jgi:hypothetical protein
MNVSPYFNKDASAAASRSVEQIEAFIRNGGKFTDTKEEIKAVALSMMLPLSQLIGHPCPHLPLSDGRYFCL